MRKIEALWVRVTILLLGPVAIFVTFPLFASHGNAYLGSAVVAIALALMLWAFLSCLDGE